MVAVKRKSAARTVEYALRQRHFLPVSARATSLRCVGRIHLHELTPSLFRFVRQVEEELRPSRIQNAFGQAVIVHQAVRFQIFDHNHTVLVHNPPTLLMREVMPLVGDSLMYASHYLASFGSFGG